MSAPVPVAPDEWVENHPGGPGGLTMIREVWRFRELVSFLALRDLKVRYKQAAFGVAWAVLQPLAGMAILTVVFHRLAHVSSGGIPYVPFVLLGYAAWTYFSSTLSGMTASFVQNTPLVTKVYFPRLAMPVAAALPSLVDLGIGLLVVAAFVPAYGISPTLAVVTLPLWLAALGVAAFGTGLVLSTLNVRYRDVGQVVGLLIQLWFFASPVAYSSRLVTGPAAWAYHLNPMVAVLDGLRWSVLAGPAPGRTCLVSLAAGLVVLAGGLRYFFTVERRFADVI
jgi:ABC-type polysaccharide/polyol phosphate export permease